MLKNLLNKIRSSSSIHSSLPAVWQQLLVQTPILAGWQPARRACQVTAVSTKHNKFTNSFSWRDFNWNAIIYWGSRFIVIFGGESIYIILVLSMGYFCLIGPFFCLSQYWWLLLRQQSYWLCCSLSLKTITFQFIITNRRRRKIEGEGVMRSSLWTKMSKFMVWKFDFNYMLLLVLSIDNGKALQEDQRAVDFVGEFSKTLIR